jgi:hypothetical protein
VISPEHPRKRTSHSPHRAATQTRGAGQGGGVVDERYVRLESTVEQLRFAVEALQRRVDALEASGGTVARGEAGPVGGEAVQPTATVRPQRDPYDPIVVLTLLGRLFLVLAGGFFLRAMTEAGLLAAPVGVGLAFAYALLWLVLADRASGRGQSSSALFHAIATALVAFPLLIEATTRFKVIGVAGSVLALLALTAAFFWVAARRRMRAIAWIAVVAAIPTSTVLLLKTGVAAPYVFYMILLAAATEWLAHLREWTLIRWPVALAADLAVAGVTFRVLSPGHANLSRVAVVLQVSLVLVYLGSIAIRTLVRDRNVTVFEITQGVVALAVGFGGAVLVTRGTETMPVLMGAASLLCGLACYALAVRYVGRHADHERNVHFYMSLALVLVLAGLALDLPESWLGSVAAGLAVASAWAWSRYGRLDVLLHATLYVAAAILAAGAFEYASGALLGSPQPWETPGAVVVVVAAATGLAAYFAAGRPQPDGGVPASGMRFALALALVWLASGCLVGFLAGALAVSTEGVVDLGSLATVRTGVLAAITLVAAALSRRDRFREWAWLVYPMLVFIGLKMVAQDFKHSRPATLFIALALFGIALIVAPRLRRSTRRAASDREVPSQST